MIDDITECFLPACQETIYRESATIHAGAMFCGEKHKQQYSSEQDKKTTTCQGCQQPIPASHKVLVLTDTGLPNIYFHDEDCQKLWVEKLEADLPKKVGSMTISTTPEEKAAAVDRSKKGFSKHHCYQCGTTLNLASGHGYPKLTTGDPNGSGLIDVHFCDVSCKHKFQDTDRVQPKDADIRPDYYHTTSVYEPFKIIRHYGLNFFEGNALKYLLRAGRKAKETHVQDLIKLRTYINSEIEELQKEK